MDKTISIPEITVLMPVFNGEKYLKDAIESILRQTFTNFEFLIINDGSVDSSVSIIESFTDSRIRLVHNATNLGLIATLNKGIELAKGSFIARMDCDDISLAQRLEKELEVFKANPTIDIVATQMLLINEEGFKTGMWSGDTNIKSGDEIKREMPKRCCIAHPSVMARSVLFQQYFYNSNQKGAEDWDLWLRMISDGKIFYKIDELLIMYRIHSGSATIIRNKKGSYINSCRVQIKYCFNKIKKLHFNFFDLRVLGNAFRNYFNHLLSLLSPSLPVALSKIFTTNIFSVISQYSKIVFGKVTEAADCFLFIPQLNSKEDNSNYAQLANTFDKAKSIIFITDRNGKEKLSPNMVDISAISSYPYLQKKIRKRILKYLDKLPSPIIVGYNSLFFYNLINTETAKIKCVDIIQDKMRLPVKGNELIYNFGIWSVAFAEKFCMRLVTEQEVFEEMKDLYEKLKINPELLNRMEYMSNFSDLHERLSKL